MLESPDLIDTRIAVWNCRFLVNGHDLDIYGAEKAIPILYRGMEKTGDYLKDGFDISRKDYFHSLIASIQVLLTQIDGNSCVREQYDRMVLNPDKNPEDSVREQLLSLQSLLKQHRVHYANLIGFKKSASAIDNHFGSEVFIQEPQPFYPLI